MTVRDVLWWSLGLALALVAAGKTGAHPIVAIVVLLAIGAIGAVEKIDSYNGGVS